MLRELFSVRPEILKQFAHRWNISLNTNDIINRAWKTGKSPTLCDDGRHLKGVIEVEGAARPARKPVEISLTSERLAKRTIRKRWITSMLMGAPED